MLLGPQHALSHYTELDASIWTSEVGGKETPALVALSGRRGEKQTQSVPMALPSPAGTVSSAFFLGALWEWPGRAQAGGMVG